MNDYHSKHCIRIAYLTSLSIEYVMAILFLMRYDCSKTVLRELASQHLYWRPDCRWLWHHRSGRWCSHMLPWRRQRWKNWGPAPRPYQSHVWQTHSFSASLPIWHVYIVKWRPDYYSESQCWSSARPPHACQQWASYDTVHDAICVTRADLWCHHCCYRDPQSGCSCWCIHGPCLCLYQVLCLEQAANSQ